MIVKRIVPNVAAADVASVKAFYADLFDLSTVMDQGWIASLAASETAAPQLNIAAHGGSGTPVPDLSIEVDDVDLAYQRATQSGYEIPYALTDEPWGVRRFYVCDPTGKVLNILAHIT